jgi:D-alanyl-lipoteichoic acid acyltransferase DltB (MBOAT superfamily)
MGVCSVPFLAFCGLLALAVPLTPTRRSRQLLLCAANLVFLVSVLPNKRSAVGLGAFVVGTYAALWLVRARPSRVLVTATVGLLIVIFVYLKRYTFLEWFLPRGAWLPIPEVLGISYMLFKFIHMVIDQSQGQLANFNFFSYANYQISFFTILAGPIQRYNDFHDYWVADRIDRKNAQDYLGDWNRLLTGMLKLGLLAPLAWDLFAQSRTQLLADPHVNVFPRFFAILYAYPVYMFLNFSGYTDIVVAAARLVGWTLPENFSAPYLYRNVIDFWSRWHMSLTRWIRDYVFMTFYKKGVEHYPGQQKLIGYALLFLSLFVSGVWHGSTVGFAVFGALHGIGAAVNQIYADTLRSRLGKEGFRAYQKSRLIYAIAVVLTFHYVAFSFLFFASSIGDVNSILRSVRDASFAALSPAPSSMTEPLEYLPLLVVLTVFVAAWKRDALVGPLVRLGQRLAANNGSLYAIVLAKSALVTLVLASLWALQKEPVIAYVRF